MNALVAHARGAGVSSLAAEAVLSGLLVLPNCWPSAGGEDKGLCHADGCWRHSKTLSAVPGAGSPREER